MLIQWALPKRLIKHVITYFSVPTEFLCSVLIKDNAEGLDAVLWCRRKDFLSLIGSRESKQISLTPKKSLSIQSPTQNRAKKTSHSAVRGNNENKDIVEYAVYLTDANEYSDYEALQQQHFVLCALRLAESNDDASKCIEELETSQSLQKEENVACISISAATALRVSTATIRVAIFRPVLCIHSQSNPTTDKIAESQLCVDIPRAPAARAVSVRWELPPSWVNLGTPLQPSIPQSMWPFVLRLLATSRSAKRVVSGSVIGCHWYNRPLFLRLQPIAANSQDRQMLEFSWHNKSSSHAVKVQLEMPLSLASTTTLDFDDTQTIQHVPLINRTTVKPLSVWLDALNKRKIGGNTKDVAARICTLAHRLLTSPHLMASFFLLEGLPGCGKSFCINAITEASGLPVVRCNTSQVFQQNAQDSESQIADVVNRAILLSPSLLVIDDIENIATPRRLLRGAIERRVVSALLSQLRRVAEHNYEHTDKVVVVLAACRDSKYLDEAFRTPPLFDQRFSLGAPTAEERFDILEKIICGLPIDENGDTKISQFLRELSQRTVGFVLADLHNLLSVAVFSALRRHDSQKSLEEYKLTRDDFENALATIRPSQLMDRPQMIPRKLATQNDTPAGLESVLKQLRVSVELPLTAPEKFAKLGVSPPFGALLYGPPGCGKSLSVEILCSSLNANVLAISGPEILSTYVGEAESKLARLFQQARSSAPCLIFIDQLESIARARGSDSSEDQAADRILSSLLTEMDGLTKSSEVGNENPRVVVIGATNRPDLLDEAIIRPGRFDTHIFVPAPSPEARKQILSAQIARMHSVELSEDAINQLALKTIGYSCADLVSLCREAAMIALRPVLSSQSTQALNSVKLTQEHFDEALRRVPGSLLGYKIIHPRSSRTQ